MVCGAPTGHADPPGGVLRVAAIDVDSRLAADYRRGSVDVVAPGTNVMTLGNSGTGTIANSGTQYAVALVAGEVALVRAAHPDLSVVQVVQRVERTAESQDGGAAPDGAYGWGLINPQAAVSQVLPEEAPSNRTPPAAPGHSARPADPGDRARPGGRLDRWDPANDPDPPRDPSVPGDCYRPEQTLSPAFGRGSAKVPHCGPKTNNDGTFDSVATRRALLA